MKKKLENFRSTFKGPAIKLELRSQHLGDRGLCEFEATLVYRASFMTAMATQGNCVLKNKTRIKSIKIEAMSQC